MTWGYFDNYFTINIISVLYTFQGLPFIKESLVVCHIIIILVQPNEALTKITNGELSTLAASKTYKIAYGTLLHNLFMSRNLGI